MDCVGFGVGAEPFTAQIRRNWNHLQAVSRAYKWVFLAQRERVVKKDDKKDEKCRKKEKWGAPIPKIMTPHGEMTIAEAAQMERDGKYYD